MERLPEWAVNLICAIIGGLIGALASWVIAWKYRRTAADAVREDVEIKANDEIRKAFVDVVGNYHPYQIRLTMTNGSEYLVKSIVDIGKATALLDYVMVFGEADVFSSFGVALFRFSAIAMINNHDDNRHYKPANNPTRNYG